MVKMAEDLRERSGGKLDSKDISEPTTGYRAGMSRTTSNRKFGHDQGFRRGLGKFCP